ncbi:hypothetical protein AB0N14_13060 [Streptomyces sp. NPDC051104]|uniref:hypothetical protein n=1 Tax=Streptomyces sp. NPDC051104 TaxID=3155044 RepID=UPI00342E61FE
MTTQPAVAAIQKKGVGTSAIDLATTTAMGGAYPAASVLARTDWVNSHKDTVQKVVDALVATMQESPARSRAVVCHTATESLRTSRRETAR